MSRQRLQQILRFCFYGIAAVGIPLLLFFAVKVGGQIIAYHQAKTSEASTEQAPRQN